MPWRLYPRTHKVLRKSGKLYVNKCMEKKWIKSNKPYKPQKRGLEKKSIWSSRFGFLDVYNRKEQHELRCPSGYNIGQCFNVMRKMWYGYYVARDYDKDIEKMKKYAKAIQDVQKDMGIKTTSFPHLGIFGDELILNNKQGERIVFEDHSALKAKQEAYKKWEAENAKQIQAVVMVPDKEKGEEIVNFPDESFSDKRFVEKLYEDGVDSDGYLIPDVLQPDEEAGEERITMADEIPFRARKNSD